MSGWKCMTTASRRRAPRAIDSPNLESSGAQDLGDVGQERHERRARLVEAVEDAAPHAVAIDQARAREHVEMGRDGARRVAQAPGELGGRGRPVERAEHRRAAMAEEEVRAFFAPYEGWAGLAGVHVLGKGVT